MKRLIKICLVVMFSIAATSVFAQDGSQKLKLKLNYNVGIPVGSFKSDYINKTSFRGLNGEIGYWFNPRVALGLSVGSQSYYQKYPRATYKTSENESISAVLSNTVSQMPVMLNGTFAPLANTTKKIQPYLSIGAGLNLISYEQYFGEFASGESSSNFTAQAGAGFMIPVGRVANSTALQFGATYNYAPYNRNGLKNLNSVGVNAGITFPIK